MNNKATKYFDNIGDAIEVGYGEINKDPETGIFILQWAPVSPIVPIQRQVTKCVCGATISVNCYYDALGGIVSVDTMPNYSCNCVKS